MCPGRLTTTVVPMTMNLFAVQSTIEHRNRELAAIDRRRWPDVAHAQRLAHHRTVGRSRPAADPARPLRPRHPAGRWRLWWHGFARSTRVARR